MRGEASARASVLRIAGGVALVVALSGARAESRRALPVGDDWLLLSTGSFEMLTDAKETKARVQWINPYAHYPYQEIYHELTHCLMHTKYARIPAWLDEGLAVYYGTFTIKSGRAEIGKHLDLFVQLLRGDPILRGVAMRWFPVDVLVSAEKPKDAGIIETPEFYVQAWATAHYLLQGNPRRREELLRYFEWIQRGMPHDYAFEHSFSIDEDELLSEVQAYVASPALPFGWVDGALVNLDVDVCLAKPSRPEVLARLGLLHLHAMPADRATEAREYFEEALSLDPNHARAHYGMAVAAEIEDEPNETVVAHLDRAVKADANNPTYLLRRGNRWLQAMEADSFQDEGPGLADRQALLARVREDLAASDKLRSDDPRTLIPLASTYLLDDADPAPAIDLALRAWKLDPREVSAPVILTLLDLGRKDEEQARQRIRDAMRMYPIPYIELLEDEARGLLPRRAFERSPYAEEIRRAIDLTLASRGGGAILPKGMQWSDLAPHLRQMRAYSNVLGAAAAVRDGAPFASTAALHEIVSTAEDEELSNRAAELLGLLEAKSVGSE